MEEKKKMETNKRGGEGDYIETGLPFLSYLVTGGSSRRSEKISAYYIQNRRENKKE